MPGGGEEKVLTLLKRFSERWKDMERGSEGEFTNNERARKKRGVKSERG